MNRLSARLAAVARHVLPGRPMADIGTDHGYLPTALVAAGAIPRAIAADIGAGPLAAARETVAAAGLLDRIDLRQGNGLQVLRPDEVGTLVLAGMGGPLMAELLAGAPPGVVASLDRLVLQPMAGEERLRRWLSVHGWQIVEEEVLAEDGRFYVVMVAEPGAQELSPIDLAVGPILRRKGGPVFVEYVFGLRQQAKRALLGAKRSDRPEAKERAMQLAPQMVLLDRIYREARDGASGGEIRMAQATVGQIVRFLEEWAPPRWAESWDQVGLQVGDPGRPVSRVLVALELTDAVLDEAVAANAELVVVHHPAIFKPLKALRFDTAGGRRLERLVKGGIGLYVAHTNLDVAEGGTNDRLAIAVGLTDAAVLMQAGEERLLKLVVFVPESHVEAVRSALAGAGAGHIGNYSHCTFMTPGTGTFLPLEGTNPYLGEQGRLELAPEVRLETILPESIAKRAVAAMVRAHPYEEVAYDLYPLANPGQVRGHGRIGALAAPVSVGELAERVKGALGAPQLRVVGDADRQVRRVAVGAGSGASLISLAAARGAEALVTGDIKYHDAQEALDLGLALIDPGHFATENLIVPVISSYLRRRAVEAGLALELVDAQAGRDPFRFC